jgi:hypothetical protein
VDDTAVFINCPYDPEYQDHLWALGYAIIDSGFRPVLALDIETASFAQFEKIKKQIARCRFSIHDLSRTGAPRFNMPLELGFALGLEHAEIAARDKKRNTSKSIETKGAAAKIDGRRQTLIICENRAAMEKVTSDIRGIDAREYNSTNHLVQEVARWLRRHKKENDFALAPKLIVARYEDFWRRLTTQAPKIGTALSELPWEERCSLARRYVGANRPQKQEDFDLGDKD